jgi:hypothetical protein
VDAQFDPHLTHATITDFNPAEDSLTIDGSLNPADYNGSLDVTVVDWPDGTGADLYLADVLVAKVTGAAGLDPASVTVSVT